MNNINAKDIARSFLCEKIELQYCTDPPEGIYNFNNQEEFLFIFKLFGHLSIGGSEYVAVSKKTGAARYLGFYGE